MEISGMLHGLVHTYHDKDRPVDYFIQIDQEKVPVNEILGQELTISYLGQKNCIHCGRKTNKTFNNGYCYPCFTKLPENDLCIVKPHLCHYDQGTCRDSSFGDAFCMIPHYVYLALSSDVKVGLTRKHNQLKRWVDQGAVRAIPIAELPTRKKAGELELHLSQFMPDKTNWRKMLKGDVQEVDLLTLREEAFAHFPEEFKPYQIWEEEWVEITYPIMETLDKVSSLTLDKQESITGKLIGIKAQYLILDSGVFQVRKHAGYQVKVFV